MGEPSVSYGQEQDISGIPRYGHDFDGSYKPREQQVGGSHYSSKAIQPVEYAMANGFNYCESFALKYLTRHREKGGSEDLRKAIHCIELLIEQEYGK